MCSILAILGNSTPFHELRKRALTLSRRQRHRGPDWSGIFAESGVILAHERLSIVDVLHGAQPLLSPDGNLALAVNGEIYNHRTLKTGLTAPYSFQTESDCEVILPLFREHGPELVQRLNGIFAFVLYDRESDRYVAARDPIGVVPLYMGWDTEGTLHLASEMKALTPVCPTVREFPPGHLLDSAAGGEPRPFYDRSWKSYEGVMASPSPAADLREALIEAVRGQLMSDVPYGVLLSGGLDSSIIAAVARTLAPNRVEEEGLTPAWWPTLHSFAIGLQGSPDLAAAQTIAEHLDTVHHTFHFTIQEGLDALSDVVYHLETYDVTTVRASTPMYLMARRIRAMGVKMVLSGEGADEVFGGYLYFHKAPDPKAFHEETVRKLSRLHAYDCLRANKSMAAWGVEARVPFLDLEFLDVAMKLDPAEKMVAPGGMEKQLLRDTFRDLLPASVATRQKEQFSDGVGYGWIDALRDHAAAEVTDVQLAGARERFPYNPPATKEAYLYRSIFETHFSVTGADECVPEGDSVACSTPEALTWDPDFLRSPDPSGRAVKGVHRMAYGKKGDS